MSRRTRKILLWSLAPVIIGVFVVANMRRSGEKRVEVRFDEAKRRDLTQVVRATGKVRSATEVNLSGTIMGQVVDLAVKEGDFVEKGQFLLRLDDAQYREDLRRAEAALASAEASQRIAQAECDRATQAAQRKRALHERGLASNEELELAETSLSSADASCDARIKDVSRFRAEVRASEDILGKTAFHAPISGVIARLNVEAGENVITGTMNNPGTVILTIADLSAMEVVAEVDETDVVRVSVGQRAKIRVDALPDTSFPGTVSEVASAGRRSGTGVDEATDFEVTIRFDQDVPAVRTEMTADVEVTTAARDSALTVPIPAVVARDRKDLDAPKPGQKRNEVAEAEAEEGEEGREGDVARRNRDDLVMGVFVVKDGKASFVPVRIGISDDRFMEILSGALDPGTKIIVGPYKSLRTLKPGKAVKPAKKTSKKSEP
jgi:HlyD family secretion protein